VASTTTTESSTRTATRPRANRARTLERRVAEALRASRRLLITSHPSPDGDAVGCTVAALLAFSSAGREVVAYNPDPVPRRFRFLTGSERITRQLPDEPFDTTLIVDCSDSRMFSETQLPRQHLGRVVVVDHHLTEGDLGEVVVRDPTAGAVGVILHRIFTANRVRITREIAEALFTSILTDTGSFRYQNANGEALQVAAALVDRGVDPWRVASHVYEDRPRCELELLALVLRTLEVTPDGLAAALTVTPEMLEQTRCTSEVIDGFINYARGVEGVEVAILFRPGPAGVRVSLRSRGLVDVSRLAERFGGGGHKNAAGFTSVDPFERVRAGLFAEVGRLLAR